jgi:hypothetical protein
MMMMMTTMNMERMWKAGFLVWFNGSWFNLQVDMGNMTKTLSRNMPPGRYSITRPLNYEAELHGCKPPEIIIIIKYYQWSDLQLRNRILWKSEICSCVFTPDKSLCTMQLFPPGVNLQSILATPRSWSLHSWDYKSSKECFKSRGVSILIRKPNETRVLLAGRGMGRTSVRSLVERG